MNIENTVEDVIDERFQWFGHVMKMEDGILLKNVMG